MTTHIAEKNKINKQPLIHTVTGMDTTFNAEIWKKKF